MKSPKQICMLTPRNEPTSICLKVTGLTLVTQAIVAMARGIRTVKWGISTWSMWVTGLLPFSDGAVDVHFPLQSSIASVLLLLNVSGRHIEQKLGYSTWYFTAYIHTSINAFTCQSTEADLMRHVHHNEYKAGSKTKVKGKSGLVSALFHQTGVNIFLPLFLHHVTHDRISISPWSFSKIDSNKQKLLRRRTTRKHRYTAFLLPCYMTFFYLGMLTNSLVHGYL